jgi:XapX domain-containing protein
MKTAIGMALAVGIGGACRYFDIPVPAPPSLLGVVLIGCIATGYILVNGLMK